MMNNRLLRAPAVVERVGFKKSWIYQRVREGAFPKPLKMGRSSMWVESEIDAWVVGRIEASRDPRLTS